LLASSDKSAVVLSCEPLVGQIPESILFRNYTTLLQNEIFTANAPKYCKTFLLEFSIL
jgi:hypothetical protein